jgi:hypothetical protein
MLPVSEVTAMSLFSKNPGKALDSARANHAKLAQRLTEANSTVDARRSAAKDLARNGATDSELDKAESQLRISQDRVTTLTAALDETTVEIATLEHELAKIADTELRAKTALKIEADAGKLIEAAKLFDQGAKALSGIAGEIAIYILDAKGLEVFCASARLETPPAIALLDSVMRSYAKSVIAGGSAAVLPGAPPPAPVAQPVAETTQVFSVREIAWRDANGDLQLSHRWRDVSLPPEIARKALAAGVVVPMQHALRRQHLNQHGFTSFGFVRTKPAREACLDLDGPLPPDAKAVAALAKSAASATSARSILPAPTKSDPRVTGEPVKFEVMPPDQLPAPRQMSVARNQLDGIATRNNKGEDEK